MPRQIAPLGGFAAVARQLRCGATGAQRHQRLPTASLKPWPAAKAGMVLEGILISLPFAGLRPARALRLRGRKVPKPTTVTLLPFAPLDTMASNTAFTASPAAVLLRLPALAAA